MNNSNKTLLQILVEELPKRGGWPEGALNATQDKDGEVCFSDGAVPEFGYAAWEGGNWCGNEFYTITAIDYATAIITRDQYESALDASKELRPYQVSTGHYTADTGAGKTASAADADGWIDWHGGECPVPKNALVDVKLRDNWVDECSSADNWQWKHFGNHTDIIAYRLQNPTKSELVRTDAWRAYAGITENDEEADLNDCIGQAVPVPARWHLLADIHAAGIKIDLGSAIFLADYLIDAGYRKQ